MTLSQFINQLRAELKDIALETKAKFNFYNRLNIIFPTDEFAVYLIQFISTTRKLDRYFINAKEELFKYYKTLPQTKENQRLFSTAFYGLDAIKEIILHDLDIANFDNKGDYDYSFSKLISSY